MYERQFQNSPSVILFPFSLSAPQLHTSPAAFLPAREKIWGPRIFSPIAVGAVLAEREINFEWTSEGKGNVPCQATFTSPDFSVLHLHIASKTIRGRRIPALPITYSLTLIVSKDTIHAGALMHICWRRCIFAELIHIGARDNTCLCAPCFRKLWSV